MPSTLPRPKWTEVDGELKLLVSGFGPTAKYAAWAPQVGAQEAFLACPVFECLLEGPRGGGKTDVLLMDFLQHVGRGWGADWRGVLFRRSFPELKDVIAKTKKWFRMIFPSAQYNEAKSTWRFATGEELVLSFIYRSEDYWGWHGQQYPWIAFEELTTWPDDNCYRVMMSCCRSARKGLPKKYRATTNPYGVGHNWVKLRFELPLTPGDVVGPVIISEGEPDRATVHSTLGENRVLLSADPEYLDRIRAAARNENELAAWVDGSWDITSGGMFDDIWRVERHVVPDLPAGLIPKSWKIDRSYDHGQSRPFSVGWWAESSGEPIELPGRPPLGVVRGDVFRIFEWYGWTGRPNEGLRLSAADIAEGILDREDEWLLKGRVRSGVADSQIFDKYEPNKSVAGDMKAVGVRWEPSDKGPGSRRQGWEKIRDLLRGAFPGPDRTREEPGLFVCERCTQWRRTVPSLPRLESDPDDVDTEAEDHVADETRYRVRRKRRQVGAGQA